MTPGVWHSWITLAASAADSPTTPWRLRAELFAAGPSAYCQNTLLPWIQAFAAVVGYTPECVLHMGCGRPNDNLPPPQSTLQADAYQRRVISDAWPAANQWPQAQRTLKRSVPKLVWYTGKPDVLDTSIFAADGVTTRQRLARAIAPAIDAGIAAAWDATADSNTWYADLRTVHDVYGGRLYSEPHVAKNTGWTADPNVTCLVLGATMRAIIASDYSGGYANMDRNTRARVGVLLEDWPETNLAEVQDWRSRGFDIYGPLPADLGKLAAWQVMP